MDVIALIGVVALWIWLARLSSQSRKTERLVDRIAALEKRLARLETNAAAPAVPSQVSQPTPQVASQPIPANVASRAPAEAARPAVLPVPAQTPPAMPAPSASAARPQAPLTPASPAVPPRQSVQPADFAAPLRPSVVTPAAASTRSAEVSPPIFGNTVGKRDSEPKGSLEEKVGTNWLNKIGIVILVIGVALFLAYQLQHMGAAGKVLVGYAVSAALLAGGVVLEQRERYKALARAGIGGGWALIFFVTYAMFHVPATQVMHSEMTDLLLMLLAASGMVAHSLRYSSQVVTGLAFGLAFSTIAVSQVTAYSLSTNGVLVLALVVIAYRRHWYELESLGLIAAYVTHFLWLQRVVNAAGGPGIEFPEFFPSAAMLLFYWAVFRASYVNHRPKDSREEGVLTFTAITNAVALMGLLKYQSVHPEWAFWALLAIGSAEMALAFIGKRRARAPFVVLSTLSAVMLVAAIPFRYDGANWSLLWVLESEALVIAGLRLRESLFQWLGILAGFAVAWKLAFLDAAPIVALRIERSDPSHHYAAALAFGAAAVCYWWNGIGIPRIRRENADRDAYQLVLLLTSYFGPAAAMMAIYLVSSSAVATVVWAVLALATGAAADWLDSSDLATQAEGIAVLSVIRSAIVNVNVTAHWGPFTERLVTVLLVIAALYLSALRKTDSRVIVRRMIPAAYTWAAAGLASLLIWYELKPVSTAVAWGMFGLFLFELGRVRSRNYLVYEGQALLAASFGRIFFVNLNAGDAAHWLTPRIYTVVPLIAAYFLVYAESPDSEGDRSFARASGALAAWCAVAATAALLYFELSPDWVLMGWSVMAIFFAALAWISKRRVFTSQAIVLAIAASCRGAFFNLYEPPLNPETFWGQRLHCVGAAIAVLFLGLFFAFRLRRQGEAAAPEDVSLWGLIERAIGRPEQFFFFAPLLLLIALLGVEMRQGMITVSWCAVGVLAFLFALVVGERSFRLAGLGLLLLGVGKILVIDVWQLAPTDRYVTLIVVGTALLLVSFLYSRYRTAIRRFL